MVVHLVSLGAPVVVPAHPGIVHLPPAVRQRVEPLHHPRVRSNVLLQLSQVKSQKAFRFQVIMVWVFCLT